VDEEHVAPAQLVADLAGRFEERQRLDVAYRSADLRDDDVRLGAVRAGSVLRTHPRHDLVGDVRDDLDGLAEVFAAALAGDNPLVHLAGGRVGVALKLGVEEALVVADVEVGFRTVFCHEHFAVLERVHRARVHVDIRVELLHDNREAARAKEPAKA